MLPSPGSCGRWIGDPSPTSGPVPAQWHNLDLGAERHVAGLVGLYEGGGAVSGSMEDAVSQSLM